MSSITVIMIRHGATAWNAAGRYQGRADLALSASGQAEAATVAERLASVPVAMVFSSPLRRAAETASHVARPHAISVRHDAALVEIDYGAWEGLTQPEIKQRWPDLLRQWKRAPEAVRFPGGESLIEARDRLRGFFARLPAGIEPGATVAVVTHQVLIRLAVLEQLGHTANARRDADGGTGTLHAFTIRHGRIEAAPSNRTQRIEQTGGAPCA